MQKYDNINLENDIVVFDVDRTIINTTSWYRACITEDLLISKENIEKYKMINDIAYNNPTKNKLKDFRVKTFNLINTKIDKAFIEKISEFNNGYFKKGDYTDSWRFYVAGVYTAYNLVKIYEDAIWYMKYLKKYYGNNLKVIFLTAGYECFIRGVVDGILSKSGLKDINYVVKGSEIEIQEGKIKELFHMSQLEKQKFIEGLINSGAKVRFLADDSNENPELYSVVEKNGGEVLKINHKSNMDYNETWRDFRNKYSFDNVKNYVKSKDSKVKLYNSNIEMPEFLEKVSKYTDEIGIVSLDRNKFSQGLKSFISKIDDKNEKNEFKRKINELIFEKEDKVFLRGKMFYNWLPQYFFLDNRCIIDKWKQLQINCEYCLKTISKHKILFKELDFFEKTIIYLIFDNLIESMLFALNLVEQNDLIHNKIISNKTHSKLEKSIQNIMDYWYIFIFDIKKSFNQINNIISKLDDIKIYNLISNNITLYKTMRELDDNIMIFKFAKMVGDELNKKETNINFVMSFPYGGITLGFALKSYMKIILNKNNLPQLVNCHYSSKQKARKNIEEKYSDFSIFDYIPNYYKKIVADIKSGDKNIMLFDNNVTTFRTLEFCKNYLNQYGNKVYAAVAAVNYDNIAGFLINEDGEKLSENWRKVLDFNAITDYITSFNTINTSKKTQILNNIYNVQKISDIHPKKIKIDKSQMIFKMCRVHNIIDLNTVIENGVNMIGIHAVYPDRIKYLKNEEKYSPKCQLANIKEDLPIAFLEVDSIKDMQQYIPENLKQAVLFERPLKIENMQEVCKLYNISQKNLYIQLQHRTDKKYINDIKEKVCNNVIATIGLFQKDFEEYFWNIHNILNCNTDYILIDFSKHQPDLINYSDSYKESLDRIVMLKYLAKKIKGNTVPILIADDTSQLKMKEYLNILNENDINVAGIDMQNCVEFKPNEQKYQQVKNKEKVYQLKIRKSPNYMKEWKNIFD